MRVTRPRSARFFRDFQLNGNLVADLDRATKAQALAQVDSSRPGHFQRQGSGYQGACEHAVGNAFAEIGARRIGRVEVQRIDVPR